MDCHDFGANFRQRQGLVLLDNDAKVLGPRRMEKTGWRVAHER